MAKGLNQSITELEGMDLFKFFFQVYNFDEANRKKLAGQQDPELTEDTPKPQPKK